MGGSRYEFKVLHFGLRESLADMLKKEGLAKDYDGEGARPEW